MNFNFPLKKFVSSSTEKYESNETEESKHSSLIKAGNILKKRREEYGISRNELAGKTRITPPIIEAIEEALVDNLPEKAYLSKMISILEYELDLPKGALNPTLGAKSSTTERKALKTFTPGNIEVLTTWQGNLIYCILMVICLFTLNYQQRRFIEFKKETLFPINANLESTTNKVKTTTDSNHAELREKSRKELSPSRTNWLNSVFNPFLKRPKVGVLKIEIFGKPKSLLIESSDNQIFNLESVQGELQLRLAPPIKIQSNPPMDKRDLIIWKGEEYLREDNNQGIYYLVNKGLSNKPIADSNVRPHTAPITP